MREAAEFGFEGAWEFAVRIVHPGFMRTEMTREGLISVGIRGGKWPVGWRILFGGPCI